MYQLLYALDNANHTFSGIDVLVRSRAARHGPQGQPGPHRRPGQIRPARLQGGWTPRGAATWSRQEQTGHFCSPGRGGSEEPRRKADGAWGWVERPWDQILPTFRRPVPKRFLNVENQPRPRPPRHTHTHTLFFICLFIYAGSLLLHGLSSSCSEWVSLSWCLLFLRSMDSRAHGLHSVATAPGPWRVSSVAVSLLTNTLEQSNPHSGLLALQHVGSSQPRDQTRVPGLGRRLCSH